MVSTASIFSKKIHPPSMSAVITIRYLSDEHSHFKWNSIKCFGLLRLSQVQTHLSSLCEFLCEFLILLCLYSATTIFRVWASSINGTFPPIRNIGFRL